MSASRQGVGVRKTRGASAREACDGSKRGLSAVWNMGLFLVSAAWTVYMSRRIAPFSIQHLPGLPGNIRASGLLSRRRMFMAGSRGLPREQHDPMSNRVEIPYRDITVNLERKKVKRLNLRVDAQGKVFLSAPEDRPMSEIMAYLESSYPWILDAVERQKERYDPDFKPEEVVVDGIAMQVHRRAVAAMEVRTVVPFGTVELTVPLDMRTEEIVRLIRPCLGGIAESLEKIRRHFPKPLRYESGETHKLWGESYPLKVEHGPGKCIGVTMQKDGLVLTVPPDASLDLRRRVMHSWYQQKTCEALEPLVRHWEGVIGVRLNDYSCRFMKTRWGSCTPARRTIRVNSALAMHPRNILEYVLVHEMCHVLVGRHDERFFSLVEKYYPEREKAEAYLHEASTSTMM